MDKEGENSQTCWGGEEELLMGEREKLGTFQLLLL
jgi:hypothetical protein